MITTGRFGVWRVERDWTPTLAAGLEGLGYGTLWIGGSTDSHLGVAESLLAATEALTVATGIVNVWTTEADVVAQSFHRLEERFRGRFLLGVGAGHRESQDRYNKPYTAVNRYLDILDADEVPAERRVLAALGERMMLLAAGRALGAHPYLTTPAHTSRAREIMGTGPLLAPEHKVVLSPDPQIARQIGRPIVSEPYLKRVNYVRNLRALGYSEEDLLDGGSDRLIDDLVLHGTDAEVAARLNEHHHRGADHVAVQLLSDADPMALDPYRRLADALGLTP